MVHIQRATIQSVLKISGIGLHTGKQISIIIKPSTKESGIVFCNENGAVKALYSNVQDTSYCTKLASKDSEVSISTVEHLIAAFAALNISDAIVQFKGASSEVPIMDGSSKPFLDEILKIGIKKSSKALGFIKILRPVQVMLNHRASATLLPLPSATSRQLLVTVGVDFPAIPGGIHWFTNRMDTEFVATVSSARTFTFRDELEKLRSLGLIKGGSLDNAVVFDENGHPLNEGGLRFQDEWVRHKALDVFGDLALSPLPLHGHYVGIQPGHNLNNQLLQKLFSDNKNYCYNLPSI